MPELEEKIRAWLDEQGYPLEMRVACAFRRAGFRVLQSDYYRDPVTQTHRELDVVAYIDNRIGDFLLRVQFIIECKSSRSKPWLLFCSSDIKLASPARVAQRAASRIAAVALHKLAQSDDVQELPIFQITDPPAYGATQAFTTGSDVVYAAVHGVGAAVAARARETDALVETGQLICAILFPVIVTEGKLFCCELKDDSSIAVTETQRGTLLWRNPVSGEPHTIVSILTDRMLQDFATTSARSVRDFFRYAQGGFEQAIKEFK